MTSTDTSMTHPDTTAQDKAMRERFEKWALPYLRRQYSFYNDDMIRDLLWKSTGRTLFAAWQACAEHFRALLSDPKMVEETAKAMVDYDTDEPGEHDWRPYIQMAQAALLAIRKTLGVE
jgi:hypothetical protein